MEIEPQLEDWQAVDDTALLAAATDGIPEAVEELARREAGAPTAPPAG